jgi:MFS family permease
LSNQKQLSRLLWLLGLAFLMLGAVLGGGGALWPEVLDAFGVSHGLFGTISGLGLALSFPVLLYGGWLEKRFGMLELLLVSIAGLGVMAIGFSLGMGGVVVFAVLLVARGLVVALLDLANNALTMDYERITRRVVMSPLHGIFSAGTIAGAVLVSIVLSLGGDFKVVYAVMAVCFFILSIYGIAVRRTVPLANHQKPSSPVTISLRELRRPSLRRYATIAGLGFAGEVLIAEWVSIYLTDERAMSGRAAAAAVGAFGAAMLVGRMVNGPFTLRAGVRPALATQGSLGLAGGLMIIGGGPGSVAIAGCFVAGLGLAGTAPTVLSLAGRAMPEATAVASGLTLFGGYIGLAGAPIMGGLLASLFSTRATMLGVAVTGLGILLIAIRQPSERL